MLACSLRKRGLYHILIQTKISVSQKRAAAQNVRSKGFGGAATNK